MISCLFVSLLPFMRPFTHRVVLSDGPCIAVVRFRPLTKAPTFVHAKPTFERVLGVAGANCSCLTI